MANERPDSPLGRIVPVSFHYCVDCNCDNCKRVFSCTFCPRCSCPACTKDPRDHTYTPEHDEDDQPSALGKRKQKPLALTTSPVKRVKADSVNTAIKNLVNEAAISAANATLPVPSNVDRFCLVSLGHSAEDCLETCHIVPRALGEDDLQRLEFAWGLRYYGLYLHSRYNLITLTPGLHASFDKGSWALVPLDYQYLHDLDKFFDKKGKWRKEPRDDGRMKGFYNGAKSFQYALLALPHDDGMRKQLIRSWTTATSASELELHFFPYDTLPIIHSHIRPHFVVYNLGTKLSGLNWPTLLFFDDRYRPLASQHPTLFTCIQRSMDLYREWTREQPPSNFGDTYSSGDQSRGADVGSANNARPTYSRRASNKSGQGARESGDSGGRGSGAVDDEDEIYPDDSLTLVFEAAAEQDDANEPPDDEHTDDESDESFYARLNTWVKSIRPGPPLPPSPAPAPAPAHSHTGSKTTTERDTDSEDGSTTFVGVVDRKTGMEVTVGLGEKVGRLSSLSFLTPGTI